MENSNLLRSQGREITRKWKLFRVNVIKHFYMSYERGNKQDQKHYWLTPPELLSNLDSEFHFTFDPCPYPKPDGFDGLSSELGSSNYVNPPFGSYIDVDET